MKASLFSLAVILASSLVVTACDETKADESTVKPALQTETKEVVDLQSTDVKASDLAEATTTVSSTGTSLEPSKLVADGTPESGSTDNEWDTGESLADIGLRARLADGMIIAK
ncbi:hypothetical protein [Candidatus Thiothrix anitrata]|uniref:Uncharacterized protein n=1 Tax=Candidatus Thiothrix anitrata TaxID=2823902 RepID=A0ABX7X895_9GAMM|nr:hypothetical protein [Candidatus Thiothrix anitrata]QTR50760.1 hypothetical protein J8380_04100 [Candidatus Thiothrix anitrata]